MAFRYMIAVVDRIFRGAGDAGSSFGGVVAVMAALVTWNVAVFGLALPLVGWGESEWIGLLLCSYLTSAAAWWAYVFPRRDEVPKWLKTDARHVKLGGWLLLGWLICGSFGWILARAVAAF